MTRRGNLLVRRSAVRVPRPASAPTGDADTVIRHTPRRSRARSLRCLRAGPVLAQAHQAGEDNMARFASSCSACGRSTTARRPTARSSTPTWRWSNAARVSTAAGVGTLKSVLQRRQIPRVLAWKAPIGWPLQRVREGDQRAPAPRDTCARHLRALEYPTESGDRLSGLTQRRTRTTSRWIVATQKTMPRGAISRAVQLDRLDRPRGNALTASRSSRIARL